LTIWANARPASASAFCWASDHDRLVAPRHLDHALDHRRIEAQRRGGVDHGEQAGLARQLRLAQAARDAGHLEGIEDPGAAQRITVEDLVGQGDECLGRVQMARRRRQVHGLDRIAAHEMDDVEGLRQADQVAVILEVAVAPAALQVGDVGRAADGGEGDVVGADGQVARRVARVQGEAGRGITQRRLDQAAVEAHSLGARFDAGARLFEDVARFGVQEVHADLFEDLHRGVVDRLDLVLGEHLDRPVGIAQHAPGKLHERGSVAPLSTSPAGAVSRHEASRIQPMCLTACWTGCI
jgi:hypothetical protein